jgi:hypothetical protein
MSRRALTAIRRWRARQASVHAWHALTLHRAGVSRRGGEGRRGAEDCSQRCHSECVQLCLVIPSERSESRNRASPGRKSSRGAPPLSIHDFKGTTLESAFSRYLSRGLARSSPISAAPRDTAVQRQEQQHFTRSSRRNAEPRKTTLPVEIPVRCRAPLHPRLPKQRLWGRHPAVLGATACSSPLRLCVKHVAHRIRTPGNHARIAAAGVGA